MAYENTMVDASKSQTDIRKVLTRHGATGFRFSEYEAAEGCWDVAIEFVMEDHLIRVTGTIAAVGAEVLAAKMKRARTKRTKAEHEAELREQEMRRIWRVLHWTLKARMEAVEEGLETLVQAFLPHVVDPTTGQTLWHQIRASVEAGDIALGGRGLPALGMRSESPSEVAR